MRIANAQDLGMATRQARQDRGWTQAHLAAAAGVSRRWLSDLENGKTTAEFGLILRTLHTLGLGLEAIPTAPAPGEIDLDALLSTFGSEHD